MGRREIKSSHYEEKPHQVSLAKLPSVKGGKGGISRGVERVLGRAASGGRRKCEGEHWTKRAFPSWGICKPIRRKKNKTREAQMKEMKEGNGRLQKEGRD